MTPIPGKCIYLPHSLQGSKQGASDWYDELYATMCDRINPSIRR